MCNANEILISKIFFFDMIQTEQWCFELEISQLCQTEHVGKMFACIHVHVLHSLTTFNIPSTMRGSRKCFQGKDPKISLSLGGGGLFLAI